MVPLLSLTAQPAARLTFGGRPGSRASNCCRFKSPVMSVSNVKSSGDVELRNSSAKPSRKLSLRGGALGSTMASPYPRALVLKPRFFSEPISHKMECIFVAISVLAKICCIARRRAHGSG